MYSPSIEDIVRPYIGYPTPIQKAIVLVETNPRFLGLTRSMKSVLKSLITRANQSNGSTIIKARLDTVAIQADVSTKTVERTMKALREAGWVQPVSEGRSPWGVFESKRYKFSAELCELIELPSSENKTTNNNETKMSDGPVYVDLSFKEDYRKIREEKRKANPTRDEITLPAVLEEVVQFGIKPSGVCKLRGLATSKGYKLEDIYLVAKDYMQRAKVEKNRAYRYLESLIFKNSDYQTRAAQIQRLNSHANDLTTLPQAKPMTNVKKYWHKRYLVGPGKFVRIFDGIAEVIRDGQWVKNIVGQDMQTVYDDIERGILKEMLA